MNNHIASILFNSFSFFLLGMIVGMELEVQTGMFRRVMEHICKNRNCK